MKRIIISGGGTGGHIYPAITIYKEIAAMTEAEFLYIGTDKASKLPWCLKREFLLKHCR